MTDQERLESVEQIEKTLNTWIVQAQERFRVAITNITFDIEQNRWVIHKQLIKTE